MDDECDFLFMKIYVPKSNDKDTIFNACHEQIREFMEEKIYERFPDNHKDLDHFKGNSTGKCSDDYEGLWTDHIPEIAAAIRDGKSWIEIQKITLKVWKEVQRVVKKLANTPVDEWSDHCWNCPCNQERIRNAINDI